MHGNGNFLEKVGEDSIAATEIDISSEDEPSRRSESLLSLDSGLPVPTLPAPRQLQLSCLFRTGRGCQFRWKATAIATHAEGRRRSPFEHAICRHFLRHLAAWQPEAMTAAMSWKYCRQRPRRPGPEGHPRRRQRLKKAPRPKAPSQNLESMASTPKQAPKERTLEAWFSPKGSPKQRRTSPEPRAKAKRRKTLAQSLKDRQKTARTKVVDKEAKAAARAEARKAKVAKTEQLLADTIRSDRNVYEKLLCFELMEIEELADRIRLANDQLRSVGRKRIRDFLEAQGFVVTQQRKIPREVFQKGYR